ncbi:hypothetical protein JRO89_XS05G0045300 [Xanthoceras sorbifolium]|uniref:Ribosomal protein L34Ae n=1 Tax=Xanthoceras sorbifolium TaxID=99658 RepID=A0ABQ8I0V7_9ROSI|nr:hypothetical protein JRO89_XS05G0045300 [Xanthoceras sorbifolium]
MGTRTFSTFLTHFDFFKRGFMIQFLYEDMFRVVDSFWVFISKFFVFVFGSILTYMLSCKADSLHEKNHQPDCGDRSGSISCKDSKIDKFEQKQDGFEVHDTEYVNKTDRETENSVVLESALASSTSKHQFLSERHITGFIEKPKTLTFSVQELYLVSSDKEFLDTGEALDQEKAENSVESFIEEKAEDSVETFVAEKDLKQQEEAFTENEDRVFTEFKFLHNYDYLLKDFSPPLDSKADPIFYGDGFSTSNDYLEGLETESLFSITEYTEDNIERILDMRDQRSDSDDEFIELEPQSQNSAVMNEENLFTGDSIEEEPKPKLENSSILDDVILSREDLNVAEENCGEEDLVHETTNTVNSCVKFEESSLEEEEIISDSDSDDEFSLEHEELLEQLKMELKNARTGGLPTIEEESESPKMVKELKPMKINQKLERKDHMLEIHKFYKSYFEKMRKLDILNSQTMHAIGLLQLKEQGQSIKTHKSSVPAIKTPLLPQNFGLFKLRKHEVNPTFKFIRELHKEFELVYVGQLCLSWEILNWQYRKAFELQEYDNQEARQYNQVAEEFQLFQVLLQRFIENEPFQSLPRIQNYVYNRSAHCNFLHVPVIKDDSLKDRKERRRDEKDAITSPMLTEIIKESMKVFWEFLRADKDGSNDVISRSPELQDSIDSELLNDIRTDFQKKEKRFKEILRSGSCIVKKFQKRHEDRIGLNHAMFFAQVELRLVSRVLNMSKLTAEELLWCHEKLANINFCNRKLLLESSFLLFPC